MFTTLICYGLIGAAVGILAGLFGVGGGTIVVPMLIMAFSWQAIPQEFIMHLALGTSFASILFTSISSTLAHNRHRGVDWGIVKRIVPGILAGTYGGSLIAAYIPSRYLQILFTLFLFYVSVNMFRSKKTEAAHPLPGALGLNVAGAGIGIFSSLVGIGGGTLIIPYLTWHNVDMLRTVGTSAALGFPIALAGGLGYLLSGYGVEGLPAGSFGYIYLPALAGIVVVSAVIAPLGASIARHLPVRTLRKGFAVFLFCMALKMLAGAL